MEMLYAGGVRCKNERLCKTLLSYLKIQEEKEKMEEIKCWSERVEKRKMELTDLEKDELRSRFLSMRAEELIFVLSLILPQLLVARIGELVSKFDKMGELLNEINDELLEVGYGK